tara:strand:- start:105 stop:971 length:867 start_codon:yes stop_codon:yes gene_type:complete
MRIIIKTLLVFFLLINIILISNSAFAGAKEELSGKLSGFFSNLIPGDGETQVSIDLRENNSPDYSILAVRELGQSEDGSLFTQFSLFNTEQNSDERIVGNLGFGKRFLSDDKFTMTGANLFFDYDDTGNVRTSFGIEARNAVLDFTYNLYKGLQDDNDEKVLDGYDMRLASQIPYLHWADIFINAYSWDGADRTDVEGMKFGSEMMLSSNLHLELAYDDKDKKGLSDDWYAKIMFVHPPRQGSTAGDGISGNMWKAEKDMSGELLTKVKRNNKIMIEFKGTSTISRTD